MTSQDEDNIITSFIDRSLKEIRVKEKSDSSVNCYFCSGLYYGSECLPADAYNDNDGGSICPCCVDEKSPQ